MLQVPSPQSGWRDRLGRLGRGGLAVMLVAGSIAACTGGDAQPVDSPAELPQGAANESPAEGAPVAGAASTGQLQPGMYSSPLVRLKRLQGTNGHLHVDEVRYRASDSKLFQCSYTFGVVDATDPARMQYLAQGLRHTIPDDERSPGCIHLAADGDIVYTTHRGNIRNPTFLTGWDISKFDPDDEEEMLPEQIEVLQEPGVSYEGIDIEDHVLFVAIRGDGLGVYTRDPDAKTITRIGELGDLGSTWGIRVEDGKAYLTDLGGRLSVVDVSDPTAPALLGSVDVGGVPRGLTVNDGFAYVAAGSKGLVIVDATDPTQPVVVGAAEVPGTAIRADYSQGRVFVAAWNDTRAYDVSDPANPTLLGAVRLTTDVTYPDPEHPPATARTLGVAADGDNVFVGNWWVLYSYRLFADRPAPYIFLPEDASLIDFGPVAAGEAQTALFTVRNDGTAPLTLFNNWTTSESFTVEPEEVVVEPGSSTDLTLTYRPTVGERETSVLNIRSDDPDQPVRHVFLVANQEGLGVGQKLPETTIALLDGGAWSSSQVEGDILVLAYFATF